MIARRASFKAEEEIERRLEAEVAVTEKRVGGFHSHFKTERRRTWSEIRKLRQESHKTDSLGRASGGWIK